VKRYELTGMRSEAGFESSTEGRRERERERVYEMTI
jgi:hypothetical protein